MGSKPVVFIDTPGIDETYMPSTNILLMSIGASFISSNERNIDTILYLHRISDNRMSGPAWRSFESFTSLCSQTKMPQLVLLTTMWTHVSPQVGTNREEQLTSDFWGDMIRNKCLVKRFDDSHESAWKILEPNDKTSAIKDHEHDINTQDTDTSIALNKQLEIQSS
ncbi:1376_t:CDS:2, partial [Acaulospora colombiana]